MKVSSTIYKGIHYVQVSELPADQKDLLLKSINAELYIKILVDGKLIRNCLQFKDYEYWFDNVYSDTPKSTVTTPSLPVESVRPLVTSR